MQVRTGSLSRSLGIVGYGSSSDKCSAPRGLPSADAAPSRRRRVAVAVYVQGDGDKQVRGSVRGRRVAGHSAGGIR